MTIRPSVVYCALLTLFGCASPRPEPDPVTFLALGDSYTIGESVPEAERWPVHLAARLRENGLESEPPAIIAKTGWTTDELAAAMNAADLQGPYDLVSVLIGVNNQYRGRDIEAYRTEFRDLLEQAVQLAGSDPSRVLVLSIPDWGVTPFAEGRDRGAIAAAIDRFNAVNADESRRAGARYVDVTPVSRMAATDTALVASDGLHPSGTMYAAWADLALPAALQALRASPARRQEP